MAQMGTKPTRPKPSRVELLARGLEEKLRSQGELVNATERDIYEQLREKRAEFESLRDKKTENELEIIIENHRKLIFRSTDISLDRNKGDVLSRVRAGL
jgi:hypothetical protein